MHIYNCVCKESCRNIGIYAFMMVQLFKLATVACNITYRQGNDAGTDFTDTDLSE